MKRCQLENQPLRDCRIVRTPLMVMPYPPINSVQKRKGISHKNALLHRTNVIGVVFLKESLEQYAIALGQIGNVLVSDILQLPI